MFYATIMMASLMLTGCVAVERRTVDLCKGLAPGASTVASIRPDSDGVLGDKNLAWPWISQQQLFAFRTEDTKLCTTQTESPSTSDLMSELSSPFSSALSHATVPVVP